MTVRQWVNFLATDTVERNISIEKENSPFGKTPYYPTEEFLEMFEGWLDDEVVKVYYKNDGHNTLLVIA